jgi:hypothetical protein
VIFPIALSALLAVGAADQGAAPEWLVDAREQFVSACVDGAPRTVAQSQEVTFAELPGAIRRLYGSHYSGHFYRLGADRPSYLIEVTRSDTQRRIAAICGLAVPGGHRLFLIFANIIHPLSEASHPPGGAPYDYLSARIVGDYVVLEAQRLAPGADTSAPLPPPH